MSTLHSVRLRIALLAAAMSALARGADNFWIGDANDNFNVAGNWSPSSVPGALDTAIFDMGVVTPPYNVPLLSGLFPHSFPSDLCARGMARFGK